MSRGTFTGYIINVGVGKSRLHVSVFYHTFFTKATTIALAFCKTTAQKAIIYSNNCKILQPFHGFVGFLSCSPYNWPTKNIKTVGQFWPLPKKSQRMHISAQAHQVLCRLLLADFWFFKITTTLFAVTVNFSPDILPFFNICCRHG